MSAYRGITRESTTALQESFEQLVTGVYERIRDLKVLMFLRSAGLQLTHLINLTFKDTKEEWLEKLKEISDRTDEVERQLEQLGYSSHNIIESKSCRQYLDREMELIPQIAVCTFALGLFSISTAHQRDCI